jgi:hypothetical protein
VTAFKAISRQPSGYFASLLAATHTHDDKDKEVVDDDDLKDEQESTGPSIEESPILQQILAKMDADDEYSSDSDSDMERGRKRMSIMIDASEADRCIAGLFARRRTGDPIE